MYRLADCYMEPTIKARAKGWILQYIKAETASSHHTLLVFFAADD